ncbi:MAG TPA: hypothetical protein VF634_12075 [Pyrinomonadaceae bacterium]|jgi:hypothetical protein
MRCLVKRLSAFSVLLLLLVSFESRAQEVLTIRGGGIAHQGNAALTPFTSHSFYFVGDGLSVRGGDEKGAETGMSCNPCAPGQTLRLNVTISRYFNSAHGTATVNGLAYYPVWFLGSELKLSITPITIPDADTPEGVKARFTMSGKLIGYSFPYASQLINREVEGEGVVRIYFTKSPLPDRPGYMFQRALYIFDARPARGRKESSQPSRPSAIKQQ